MRRNKVARIWVCSMALLAMLTLVAGPASASSTEDLAKAAQNPVADLISVPFQNNTQFGLGPHDRVQNILNIQPVYPIHLTDDWNIITRTIFPVVWQPDVARESGTTTGLGDINMTLFFSPSKPGKIIWGVGPIFQFPTASDDVLGTGKYTAGLAAVVLAMPGKWTLGFLVNNMWSYAGDSDRGDVNQMLFQYFINYNLPNGWYLISAPIITANWEAETDDRWVVPFGGGFGKIFRIGKLPLNFQVQGFYYAEKPEGGPDWSLRLQLQFMFPK